MKQIVILPLQSTMAFINTTRLLYPVPINYRTHCNHLSFTLFGIACFGFNLSDSVDMTTFRSETSDDVQAKVVGKRHPFLVPSGKSWKSWGWGRGGFTLKLESLMLFLFKNSFLNYCLFSFVPEVVLHYQKY